MAHFEKSIQIALFAAALAVVCQLVAAAQPAPNPDARTLQEHGIEASLKGVTAFLKSLDPTDEARKARDQRVAKLISQLGHVRFVIRERARVTLLQMPVVPVAQLTKATKSADLEIAVQAEKILADPAVSARANSMAGLIGAVCRTIRHQKIKGAAAEILGAMKGMDEPAAVEALKDALAATVVPADEKLLRQALRSPNLHIKIAAVAGFESALGKASGDELAKMLADGNLRVRLAAARALANQGDRRSLASLTGLLEAEDVSIRVRSARILRALTGQNFGFIVYDAPEKRRVAVQKWQAWLKSKGQTAALAYPLRLRRVAFGKTIITDYSRGRVYEVDERGKKIWEISVRNPWGCQGLPNGHRVISSYSGKFVVEYDAKGKEVWRINNLPGNAMGLHRLENGNTLVACSHSRRVVEYARNGKLVWSVTLPARPVDVRRLENGRTLVALESGGNKIVEIDNSGKILWQIAGINTPLSVRRLENGNSLVALSNSRRAIEYDRSGKKVWEFVTARSATGAVRLADGDTIVSSHNRVKRVAPDGTVRWTFSALTYCYGIAHY